MPGKCCVKQDEQIPIFRKHQTGGSHYNSTLPLVKPLGVLFSEMPLGLKKKAIKYIIILMNSPVPLGS